MKTKYYQREKCHYPNHWGKGKRRINDHTYDTKDCDYCKGTGKIRGADVTELIITFARFCGVPSEWISNWVKTHFRDLIEVVEE